MWHINTKGEKEFAGGNNDPEGAAREAEKCLSFKADDEDERVADEPVSCYNCRYRRWLAESFICCK